MATEAARVARIACVGVVVFSQRLRVGLRGAPKVSLLILISAVVIAVFAPWVYPYDPLAVDFRNAFAPPVWAGGSTEHLLGTDNLGRDELSRLIQGARISVFVGLLAVAGAGTIGTVLGLVAGYFRGWYEVVIMRLTEAMIAMPFLMVAILIVVILGPSMRNVIITISILQWPSYAMVVRSETLKVRELDFVQYAGVVGSGRLRTLRVHIAPNVRNTVIVLATLQLGTAIISEATLSFLGMGIPKPVSSWGSMLSEAQLYLAYSWWLAVLPGLAITSVVLAGNMTGDWLRDRLDPTLRQL